MGHNNGVQHSGFGGTHTGAYTNNGVGAGTGTGAGAGYGSSTTTGHSGVGGTGAGYGSSATPGSGNAQNTAGPHNSDLLNKLDPRVDSDLSGGKTYGGNATNQ